MKSIPLPTLLASLLAFPCLTGLAVETQTGLLAGYFPGPAFTGSPIIRCDQTIAFSWPTAPIDGLPSDRFSVRWQGLVTPRTHEPTILILSTDDGARMWIDGSLVVNDWTSHSLKEYRCELPAGSVSHEIRIDYFEDRGVAVVKLEWESASVPRETVPANSLTPAASVLIPAQTDGSGLSASYFPYENLTGNPWIRRDPRLDFNWGAAAPAPGIPADRFSVRWSGQIQTRFAEPYELILTADDGVRVWIDDVQVVSDWIATAPKERRVTLAGGQGTLYRLKIEYFERTGGAVARLEWQSPSEGRQIVPETCLHPNDLDVVIPSTSATSPAFMEGTRRLGVEVNADGAPVTSLGESRFAVNIPLTPQVASPVSIRAGLGHTTGQISWTPTELSGARSVVVRPGDSLLFSAPVNGTWSITRTSGFHRPPGPIVSGTLIPVLFSAPGRYTAVLDDEAGSEVGYITIDVPGFFDVPTPIPCEVAFTRGKPIALSDAGDRALISWTAIDDWISVTPRDVSVETSASVQTLSIKPNENRAGFVSARINGTNGAVLASWEVRPFQFRDLAEKVITCIAVYPDGSRLVEGKLLMEPRVENLDIVLRAYVSGITIEGGGIQKIIPTNSMSEWPNGAGIISYRLVCAPNLKTGSCHTAVVTDAGTVISK